MTAAQPSPEPRPSGRADAGLSTTATRLHSALRTGGATTRAGALTDQRLAELTALNVRDQIDAARELLNAGIIVLAACEPPYGRWLGTLAEALAYRDKLLHRVKTTAGRISALDVAIRKNQGQLEFQGTGSTGTLGLSVPGFRASARKGAFR